jgi:tetratricopeptide (TPR) repeat protein
MRLFGLGRFAFVVFAVAVALARADSSDQTSPSASGTVAKVNPNTAILYYNRGIDCRHAGDLDAAVANYTKAIEYDPQFAAAYSNRANARSDKGDDKGALTDYRKALALDPLAALTYYNRSTIYLHQGDHTLALQDLEKAIELAPKLPRAYNDRGIIRQHQGDLAGALRDFSKAIELDPNYADAYDGRGGARWKQGNLEAALADYTKAVELSPKDARLYHNRGLARKANGDTVGALEDHATAIRLDPSFALGSTAGARKPPPSNGGGGVIPDFFKAAHVDPKFAPGYHGSGVTYACLDDWSNAYTNCDAALQLDDYDVYAAFLRFIAQEHMGQHAPAAADLAAAVKQRLEANPDDWPCKIATFLLGSTTEPELLNATAADDAATTAGRRCEAWCYVGYAHLTSGRKAEAADCFRKALATEQKTWDEYRLAKAELARLEAK